MYVTRQELRDLLEVSETALKSIVKRDKLSERIEQINYKLICQCKIGRSMVYELEPLEKDLWSELQKCYKIRKKDEHTQYTLARLENFDKSRSRIIKENKIEITCHTAKRYDDILVNENAMEVDGLVYYMINKNTNEMTKITEEEYKIFWKDNVVVKNALSDIKRRRSKFEISEDFSDYSVYTVMNQIKDNDSIAIKFTSYKEAENAKHILELIKKIKTKH